MKYLIITIFLVLFILVGCSQEISDIKNEEYIGEDVIVRGTVNSSIKIGDLSGYSLVDKNDNSIPVSSNSLPTEGETVTVRGTLMKDSIFGYYIQE